MKKLKRFLLIAGAALLIALTIALLTLRSWIVDGQCPAIDIKQKDERPAERGDNMLPEDACVTAVVNRPEYSEGFYQISSWQELQWMENCLYESYKLTGNITIPEPGQGELPQAGFRPVGTSENQFTGHFDGGGYSITGLSILRSGSDYVGLFGYVYGGRIENLHIEHSGIEGKNNVGAVVGYAKCAEIEEVSMESESTKKVSGTDNVGGLVGKNNAANADVSIFVSVLGGLKEKNSVGRVTGYAMGAVSGDSNVGGLVGNSNGGDITGYATGAVSGDSSVGGLVGNSNGGDITGYATGAVSGDSGVGGLVGDSNGGDITGYATGAVSGASVLGGLVGESSGGDITGYATGGVSGTGDDIGGLVGESSGDDIIGYATGAVSGTGDDIGGLVGETFGSSITGYYDEETASVGGAGVGITSTENIYYYTAASETSGREQNKYYDKGTGNDPSNQDVADNQIFSHGDFASIFEFPIADGRWPKLKESFTVDSKTITLTDAIYNAQDNVVNWKDATANTE